MQNSGTQQDKALRDERRAKALRENLKRRKAQSRGRADHTRPADQDPNASADAAKDGT